MQLYTPLLTGFRLMFMLLLLVLGLLLVHRLHPLLFPILLLPRPLLLLCSCYLTTITLAIMLLVLCYYYATTNATTTTTATTMIATAIPLRCTHMYIYIYCPHTNWCMIVVIGVEAAHDVFIILDYLLD